MALAGLLRKFFHREGTEETKGADSSDNLNSDLRTTTVDNMPGSRRISDDLEYLKKGMTSAKAQNTPTVLTILFSDLCALSAFAGDIPSFGCGCAAPGPSW
ncbi:MAG: hypothetical protein ACXW4Z_18550 [Candidatus Binatia bacterium]